MLGRIILAGLLAGGATQVCAQVITEPVRALAARDSLLQTAAATRLELAQRTTFTLTIPNKTRRHTARGYVFGLKETESHSIQRIRTLVWKHRTIYRRNGRVQEKYTAYMYNRRILEERWLDGSVLWMRISRPQDLKSKKFSPQQPAFNGTYVRGGYVSWNGQKYLLL